MATSNFTAPQIPKLLGTSKHTPRKAPINKDPRKLFLPVPSFGISADFGRQTSFERSSISSSPIGILDESYTVDNPGLDNDTSDHCCDNPCEEACGGCCDDIDCPAEPCAEAACHSFESSPLHSPCAGFVDCDDTDPCTRPECVEEECREIAPPCYNSECLEGLLNNSYDPTYSMATDGRLPTQHHWFTTAGGAALHPPREGTSSNDQEYYFKHTGVLDQLDQSHVHQGSGDLDIKGVGWVDGYSYQPAKRRRTFEGDSGIDFGRLALQSPIEQQIQPQIDTTANPIHCQWGEHCNQSFFDWNTLEGHVQSTHITTQPTVQCHWNGCEEPTHPSMVLSHVKRKHDFEDQHVCLWGGCSQAFTDHRELEQHLQNAHAPPNSLLCEWDRCGLVAEDPFDLKEHLQIDHCFDPRFMTLDSEAGTGQPGLPHGMQPKQCAWTEGDGNNGDAITCGLMFDDAEALHTHIKAAHTDRLNQKLGYFCQWKDCDRRGFGRFSQKGKLERHVQVHTGYKPRSNQCSICGLLFSTRQAVQQHERRHTGEKPYRCETCGKTFTAGSSLSMHRRKHTDYKPLKCPFPGCDKSFNESSNLSKHKKTHNATPEHLCPHEGCNMRFHRMDQLKRHAKAHGNKSGTPSSG